MVSESLYTAFMAVLGLERGFELWLSRRNVAWARAQGGLEYGQEHLRWMKLLHVGFFAGSLVEVWLLGRTFVPALGFPCLVIALGAQALRYWAISTLGSRWNVAVVVLPGVGAVTTGPYRFLRHPNYVAVVAEGVAVPLIHGAFLTAIAFTALNAWLLSVRIRCEEAALSSHSGYAALFGTRPRFWPTGSGGV